MGDINILEIRKMVTTKKLRWTQHIFTRLIQRGISTYDIECAILNGEIIEEYPSDYPYPSCLILGMQTHNKPVHIVCGIGENELWLITAYYPKLDKWENDFKTRKEQ